MAGNSISSIAPNIPIDLSTPESMKAAILALQDSNIKMLKELENILQNLDSENITDIDANKVNVRNLTAESIVTGSLVVGTNVGQGTAVTGSDVTTIVGNTITTGYISALGLSVGNGVGQGSAVTSGGVTTIIGGTVTTEFLNAKNITAAAVAAENLTGTLITGKTINTLPSGNNRIVMDSSGITTYNSANQQNGMVIGADGKIWMYRNGNVYGFIEQSLVGGVETFGVGAIHGVLQLGAVDGTKAIGAWNFTGATVTGISNVAVFG